MMLSLFGAFLCMTGKSQISSHKWERMRLHYLTGSVTLKELSRLYGVGYSTVRRYASRNDWFAHKRSQQILIEAKMRNDLSQRLLEQAEGLQGTARHCIPMKAGQHYSVLIKLMQLKLRLNTRERIASLEESPRQLDNVIPLHRPRHQSATRRERSLSRF